MQADQPGADQSGADRSPSISAGLTGPRAFPRDRSIGPRYLAARNLALSDWGRYLGDATLTAAILDRIAMRAIRIHIEGPS